jgi:ABC-type antimicrobial peptide transport system permease subunit
VTTADFNSWIDSYGRDPEAIAIDLDPDALRAETRQRIAGWNDLGRGVCSRFLDVARLPPNFGLGTLVP